MERRYPHKDAEHSMTTAFPKVRSGSTIADVERMITGKAKTFETLDYIYVVDGSTLKGILSIKELFDSPKSAKVDDVMKTSLITAHPMAHQETLVYLALKHDIKAIPIVDKGMKLLGVVPYNRILDIFNEEIHEDALHFGGVFVKAGREYTLEKASVLSIVKRRLPWLIIGVLGGAVVASVVTSFEDVLSELLVLAAFTPVLAYLSDAVGTQSETLLIRGMALNPKLSFSKHVSKELKVAVPIAMVCALLLAGVALVGWGKWMLGFIVGASMFLSIVSVVMIASVLPFFFRRFGIDPAFASGPFSTMVSDIATIVIYFLVASLFLKNLAIA